MKMEQDLISLCEDFISYVNILFNDGKISSEKLQELTKSKKDFLETYE